jgi:hypothetical protein
VSSPKVLQPCWFLRNRPQIARMSFFIALSSSRALPTPTFGWVSTELYHYGHTKTLCLQSNEYIRTTKQIQYNLKYDLSKSY